MRVQPVPNANHDNVDSSAKNLLDYLEGRLQDESKADVGLHHTSAKWDQSSEKIAPIPAYMPVRKAYQTESLCRQFAQIPREKIASIFNLFRLGEADVVIEWEISTEAGLRKGWTLLLGLIVGPRHSEIPASVLDASSAIGVRSMYEETSRQKLALRESILSSYLTAEDNPLSLRLIKANATAEPLATE